MKLSIRSWLEISMLAAIALLIALMFILKRPQYPTYTRQDFERLADSAAVQAATIVTQNQNVLWKDLDSSNQAIAKQVRDGNQRLERIGTIVANIQGAQGGGHSDTLTPTHAVYSDPELWIRYDFPPKDLFTYKQRNHELRVKVVETDTGSYIYIRDITANRDIFVKDAQFVRYRQREGFLKGLKLGVEGGIEYRNKYEDMALLGMVTSRFGTILIYRGLKRDGRDWGVGLAKRVF